MIRIQQLKLKIEHSKEDLEKAIAKKMKIAQSQIDAYIIKKQSIDARKRNEILYVYTVDIIIKNEKKVLQKLKDNNISFVNEIEYSFPINDNNPKNIRPIIIGSGPAGLFCGLMLAKAGFAPLILERGQDVDKRKVIIDDFWNGKALDLETNVQFGEGGAGTFSDGKLNTLVKDVKGRNKKVLEIFVDAGAPEDILYTNKPHIGTDILISVVKNIRNQIIEAGGQVLFGAKVTEFILHNESSIKGVKLEDGTEYLSDMLVLAIGHSARDTFEMIYSKTNINMDAKAFAVGVRVEHPQGMINEKMYGVPEHKLLPAAPYKLTANLKNKRGVYSFCMCPGGYVVNASSENNRLVVNGMSYHSRNGKNANSAIIVSITPEDFKDSSPLAGMNFQRELEERAYELGNGKIPVQLFGDFCKNKITEDFKEIQPAIRGAYQFANLRDGLPEYLSQSIIDGITVFGKKIKGFDREDAILSGFETRTSSPVRILRDESFESNLSGLFPCGEGAGYAGGIMSAAMDGLKVAEAIAEKYKKYYNNMENE